MIYTQINDIQRISVLTKRKRNGDKQFLKSYSQECQKNKTAPIYPVPIVKLTNLLTKFAGQV